MAQELDVLLARVSDPALRADLERQIGRIRSKQEFGLVFESHLPETVRLPSHPVRRGAIVALRDADDDRTLTVRKVVHGAATIIREDDSEMVVPVADLVVVADFGDPIYPGLKPVGSVHQGGDRPAQVVISGENHHVLEALTFSHSGKVDAIYIDPPYNTRARDWKYNNDYVEPDDTYRHSKWLAFMHRRLKVARELLNPAGSVLMVTIDEREVHRLGLLIGQVFPEADVQLVTVVQNRAGSPRPQRLTRVEEYLFYVFIGAGAAACGWSTNMLSDAPEEAVMPTVWFSAIRVGSRKALRSYYKDTALFYPVLIDANTGALHSIGEALPMDQHPEDYTPPTGTVPIWPLSNGREQTWRFAREGMEEFFANGTARLGKRDPETGLRPVTYLRPGTLQAIDDGLFTVVGRSDEGALKLALGDIDRSIPPASVWNMTSHYARDHGSKLLARFIPGRDFDYPKSLYAVEDTLRVAVGSKPDAVILDFFAGSGTTAHAVARLNRQDGGHRQSIIVTNNEVSDAEAQGLRSQGHRPGDPEWEALGIFQHITKPRVTAAVTGLTPAGEPVIGDYAFTDLFPMADGFEENVEFFELMYLDAEDVALDLAFEAVAPLLWLRAGGQGPIIGSCVDSAGRRKAYAFTEQYAVLFNTDRWSKFTAKLPADVRVVFIVTDSDTAFAAVAAELPTGVEAVRLYENYLTTFSIIER